MNVTLEASYRYCRRIARTRARNFYYSFLLLKRPQRDAMCALYTFNRICDDISDEPAEHGYDSPLSAIDDWRGQLEQALDGEFPAHPAWPAFHDTVVRYQIPRRYFFEMIEGVSADLDGQVIATFDELHAYCYKVASAVGLSILHVFGFESEEALPLAEKCGIAFQLTNILRDVREDALMGRVYLPREDLERFGVSPDGLRDGSADRAFRDLMRFESQRAMNYYREAAPLIPLIAPGSRGSMWALIRIYNRLLGRIREEDYDVLSRRVQVPAWEKSLILARGMLGASSPNTAVPG